MSSYNYACIIRIEIKWIRVEEKIVHYIRHTLWIETCVGTDDSVYIKLEDDEHGNEYYSYIIVYVDGVLCILKDPNKYLNMVYRYFRLKDPPECPTMYLGEDISKFVIPNDSDGVNVGIWAQIATTALHDNFPR